MALVLADRVQQTGTANTTVSFTLSGSVTGFQSFTAGVGNGNTTYYAAYDASGNWEVGLGTYSTTGPTLTRTTIYASSNSGSAVTFSGTVNVFVTYAATRSVYQDDTSLVTVPSLAATASVTASGNKGAISYGTLGYSDTNILASYQSSVAGYNQIVLQNTSNNAAASANFNISNNAGTATTNYGEFGINSSTFTGSGAFSAAGTTYLASASTDLAIGTYGSNAIHFVVNNGATDAATISSAGLLTANSFASSSAAITGGSINNTTIGASTANTGKFTTLECTSVTDASSLARNSGQTANVTINNTTTYTTGGVTLASQSAATGSVWRVRAFGQYTAASSGTARTARVACFWGATQLTAITSTVLTSTAQTTQWQCEFTLTASSATAIWTAGTFLNRVGSTTALAIDNATPASTGSLTTTSTLDLRFSMSSATPADSWIIQSVTLERLE